MGNYSTVTRPQNKDSRQSAVEDSPPFPRPRPATLLTQGLQPAPLTHRNLKRLNKMTSSGPPLGSSGSPPPLLGSSSSGSLGLDTLRDSLKSAGVVTLFEPPSPEIQSQLDIIWACEQSNERREEVTKIANKLSRKFSRIGAGQRGDDWIESIVRTLEELDSDEIFAVARKAGIILTFLLDVFYNSRLALTLT